jgi:3-hydroxy-3-methylglutaryl CoA synthase/NAD(P)-dependent dehydrogenase (short-subunit alcohol dehydrogenase family)/putative sterol carrier protein
MVGITSFGGYIPRLRLDRMSIVQHMGWFAPAIVMVAQGERSFCNWDEDSLTMAVAAARDCLRGADKTAVDALYLCSTTLPFSDRLNAGIVKTALNLKDNVITADLTSSLRAGTTGLLSALSAVGSGDVKQALVTASDKREAKAAYFYEMWFGDGAAALLVGSDNAIAEFRGSHSVSYDFVDHYRGEQHRYDYMWEERWVRDEGYAKIIPEAVFGLLDKLSLSMDQVDKLAYPCFFKTEHRKIASKLGARPDQLIDNLHEVCGETGAAHPLVMLVRALEEAKPGDRIIAAGFGQGCDALCFEVTENILALQGRAGIKGSLARKKTVDNYPKFLKFRDLLQTEMGIRAEFPCQTAMTVLWRKRGMLTGMVGGKCTSCGTPQFPKMDVCVNPECRSMHTQDDYEFADAPAVVKSFTGDLLSVSVDPPAMYGMVQFEAGGRFMADFTDCELADVRVGQSVDLAFRKRFTDKERGFTGYFWKAIPVPQKRAESPEQASIRFDGRVAVVTGAGAGLGRVYALELAKRGAKLVVNDLGGARDGSGRSATPADQVVDEIRALGGEAVASYDSVSTVQGGEAIIRKAVDSFGRVDIVINNAGILRDKTLAKMEPVEWDLVMSVHLDGAFHVTRPAFLRMREQGFGRIVVTTSAAGLYGNFGQSNYAAAKMGLVGFMNALKLEGEKHDIRVNAVAPIAATRLTEDILAPELLERLKPEFIAPMVLYLCSEACTETGMIFNAGMGCFNRAAILTGPGAVVGDGRNPPGPEQIHQQWTAINTLDAAKESGSATAALGTMLDAIASTGAPSGPTGGLTVKDAFDRIQEAFQADKAKGVDVVFQFRITGPLGGQWHVTVKENVCEAVEGVHQKPTTTVIMSDEDFLSFLQGKISATRAYTSGKLKIEGDLMKSQLIEKLFRFQ